MQTGIFLPASALAYHHSMYPTSHVTVNGTPILSFKILAYIDVYRLDRTTVTC